MDVKQLRCIRVCHFIIDELDVQKPIPPVPHKWHIQKQELVPKKIGQSKCGAEPEMLACICCFISWWWITLWYEKADISCFSLCTINLSLSSSWRWDWAMKYVDVEARTCVQGGKAQALGVQCRSEYHLQASTLKLRLHTQTSAYHWWNHKFINYKNDNVERV